MTSKRGTVPAVHLLVKEDPVITFLRFVNRWLARIEAWLSWAAAGALIAMMGLVNANVFLRPLGMPVWGVFEVVGFLGALVISFSLIHPTLHGGHLSVELLVSRLPRRVQEVLGVINRVVGLFVFGLIAWQTARYGYRVWAAGQVSGTLKMPLSPILWGLAAAFGVSALVLVVDLLNRLFRVEGGTP